jgi:hypothetical protein
VLFSLILLKLGTPAIFDTQIPLPQGWSEWMFAPWPLPSGYVLLALAAIVGLRYWRRVPGHPSWVWWMPLAWLAWQCASAAVSVDGDLSALMLRHFFGCVFCFFFGLVVFGRLPKSNYFWAALLFGFVCLLWSGWDQKFGGLEQTRQYKPDDLPPELLARWNTPDFQAKLASNRIFATFVYPNALAGALLLLSPGLMFWLWSASKARFEVSARILLVGLLAVGVGGCLYWSGSKAGWLVALGMVAVSGLRLLPSGLWRRWAVTFLLVVGLGAFAWRYAAYFQKGATSVGARFEYWRAAVKITARHPVFGSGPGTFSVLYRQIKPPGAEMARLTHNDFMQQASDSGLLGFLAYGVWVGGGVIALRRLLLTGTLAGWVWLGVAGFFAQSLVEFHLYIPALAWPAFLLLGWLWSTRLTLLDKAPGGSIVLGR